MKYIFILLQDIYRYQQHSNSGPSPSFLWTVIICTHTSCTLYLKASFPTIRLQFPFPWRVNVSECTQCAVHSQSVNCGHRHTDIVLSGQPGDLFLCLLTTDDCAFVINMYRRPYRCIYCFPVSQWQTHMTFYEWVLKRWSLLNKQESAEKWSHGWEEIVWMIMLLRRLEGNSGRGGLWRWLTDTNNDGQWKVWRCPRGRDTGEKTDKQANKTISLPLKEHPEMFPNIESTKGKDQECFHTAVAA